MKWWSSREKPRFYISLDFPGSSILGILKQLFNIFKQANKKQAIDVYEQCTSDGKTNPNEC